MSSSRNDTARPTGGRVGLRRRLWGVAEALASPRRPEDYLDMFHPLRRGADLRARVVAVQPEAGGAVTVVLQPGAGWRGHVPGQYVRVGLDVDGIRRWRSYSLTSPPESGDGTISITARPVPDGLVSAHLAQRLAAGDLVHLDQACGDFVLPDPVPEKVLFITGGSGITPVIGMLRAGLHRLRDVVLVHSDATDTDVIFGPELRELAAGGRIRLVEKHTRTSGRLEMAELLALVPDLADRESWACGPAGLLDEIESYWADLGSTHRLRTERFRAALTAAGDGGTVEFTVTGKTVTSAGNTPIMDVGEANGVLMPSGCRMGICFSCVLPLREGTVRDLRNGEITVAAVGDGVLVQTCVTAAAGACRIDH